MKEKKFDYRKYITENEFVIGNAKSKNFENSKNVVDAKETTKKQK